MELALIKHKMATAEVAPSRSVRALVCDYVAQLTTEFHSHLIGVTLGGSYAVEQPNPGSDVDLLVVTDLEWAQSRMIAVESLTFEVLIRPLSLIKLDLTHGTTPIATRLLSQGIVLFDPKLEIQELKVCASAALENPWTPARMSYALRSEIYHTFRKLLYSEDLAFDVMAARLVELALRALCFRARQWPDALEKLLPLIVLRYPNEHALFCTLASQLESKEHRRIAASQLITRIVGLNPFEPITLSGDVSPAFYTGREHSLLF